MASFAIVRVFEVLIELIIIFFITIVTIAWMQYVCGTKRIENGDDAISYTRGRNCVVHDSCPLSSSSDTKAEEFDNNALWT